MKRIADPRARITRQIKATAQEKITGRYPTWKQLNAITDTLEVMVSALRRKRLFNDNEELQLKETMAMWEAIRRIRDTSDQWEHAVLNREPFDLQKERETL